MSETDNIALIDLDGTVADHDGALLRDLEALRAPEEPPIDLSKWRDKSKMPPHISYRTYMIRDRSSWWENLPVIQKGMDLVNLMQSMGYRIVILTQGPRTNPSAWKGKVKWINKYFGTDIDMTITRDKGMVYGKVLFDDYPVYMDAWLEHRPRGLGIMNAFPYNEGYSNPQVIRWDSETITQEIIDALQRQLERKAREAFQL